MNKKELIAAVAERSGVPAADTSKVIDATLECVQQTLAGGDDVAISGFGKFSVTERAAREGVNPATKERIQIAASRSPKFTAGAKFKQAISG